MESRLAKILSKILETIGVIEIERYSVAKVEAEAPFGVGVMLAVRQRKEKIPEFSCNLNTTANSPAKIETVFWKNRGEKKHLLDIGLYNEHKFVPKQFFARK